MGRYQCRMQCPPITQTPEKILIDSRSKRAEEDAGQDEKLKLILRAQAMSLSQEI